MAERLVVPRQARWLWMQPRWAGSFSDSDSQGSIPGAPHLELACHRILRGTSMTGQTERGGSQAQGPQTLEGIAIALNRV